MKDDEVNENKTIPAFILRTLSPRLLPNAMYASFDVAVVELEELEYDRFSYLQQSWL